MASGIKVTKECAEKFEQLKMHHAASYIVFHIANKDTEICVDKMGEKDAPYEELTEYLKECAEKRECRYAAYDCHFEFKGKPKEKIVFIAWNPENAVTKQKMIYTSSKDYLKKQLKLVIELQATDMEELSRENLEERAQRGMKD